MLSLDEKLKEGKIRGGIPEFVVNVFIKLLIKGKAIAGEFIFTKSDFRNSSSIFSAVSNIAIALISNLKSPFFELILSSKLIEYEFLTDLSKPNSNSMLIATFFKESSILSKFTL